MPTNELIRAADSALLLVDHQSGLRQVVKDIPVHELRTNLAALARAATLAAVPVIVTASVPEGPNGPLLPEVTTSAPHATYVRRQGQINAWDVEAFRAAVEVTNRKSLIIAGITTSICVVEPALAAIADGYTVYTVIDAPGTYSDVAQRVSVERLSRAGATVVDTEAAISELQETWARDDAGDWAALHAAVIPAYQAITESVGRATAEAANTDGADAEIAWAISRHQLA